MAVLIIHGKQGECQQPNVLVFACARKVTPTMTLEIVYQLYKRGLRASVLTWPEKNMQAAL